MNMCSSFTLRLPHEELAQLRICLGFSVKEVVLEYRAVAKPRGSEKARQPAGLVQVGNCDLYIYDILSAESWNGGRTDVIDSNRGTPDQVADVPRNLRELVHPVGADTR